MYVRACVQLCHSRVRVRVCERTCKRAEASRVALSFQQNRGYQPHRPPCMCCSPTFTSTHINTLIHRHTQHNADMHIQPYTRIHTRHRYAPAHTHPHKHTFTYANIHIHVHTHTYGPHNYRRAFKRHSLDSRSNSNARVVVVVVVVARACGCAFEVFVDVFAENRRMLMLFSYGGIEKHCEFIGNNEGRLHTMNVN